MSEKKNQRKQEIELKKLIRDSMLKQKLSRIKEKKMEDAFKRHGGRSEVYIH